MKIQNIYSYLFLLLLPSLVLSQAQDLDKSFLDSLPEDIKEDLLKENLDRKELEKTQYKRPSTYIKKPTDDGEEASLRFGSKIFSMMQTTLMPFNEPNFDGNYILDFGDVLELQLTGQKISTNQLLIKRDGSINIPEIGKIFVSGLSLDKAVDIINKKINSSFLGVDAYVTLVSVRDIQVIIAGNVYNPGPYTLNGNSNLFHALSVSGGPSEDGSYRKIDLIRDSKVIYSVDLYDIFIYGNSSFSTRLRSGDVVFIRPVMNLVTISGGVKRPGIYELKKDETLYDSIFFANGLSNRADMSDVNLFRLEDGTVKTIKINDLASLNNMISRDDDNLTIRVHPYRSVEIKGAVRNPGVFLINEGDGIADLISTAGGYTKTAYPFGGVLENIQTKEINRIAAIKLYEAFIQQLSRMSSIPEAQGDMRFISQIMEEIKNSEPSGRVSAEFNIEKLEKNKNLDIQLQEGDIITIPEFLDHIYVFGEINNEGTIRYVEGMDTEYYINKKGGFNEYANKDSVFVVHPNGETSLISKNKNIFMRQDSSDLNLYPGSVIFVPRDTVKIPFSVAAQAYASILGNIGVSLASVSVLKD